MLSPHDEAHITMILTQNYGDWFSAHLLRLIAKADMPNRAKLRQVYPHHVALYERYLLYERE